MCGRYRISTPTSRSVAWPGQKAASKRLQCSKTRRQIARDRPSIEQHKWQGESSSSSPCQLGHLVRGGRSGKLARESYVQNEEQCDTGKDDSRHWRGVLMSNIP